jgi:osmotically-inducible protein OsmY
VQFVVQNGHVTVSGTVQWYYQAHEVAHEAGRVTGVLSVTNNISVEKIDTANAVNATHVQSRIRGSLQRAANLDASRINVAVSEGTVTLSGTVRSWLEHDKAAEAAWSVPGVERVDNCIAISTI